MPAWKLWALLGLASVSIPAIIWAYGYNVPPVALMAFGAVLVVSFFGLVATRVVESRGGQRRRV